MPIAVLDPKIAFIVVDPTQGIVGLPTVVPRRDQTGKAEDILELLGRNGS